MANHAHTPFRTPDHARGATSRRTLLAGAFASTGIAAGVAASAADIATPPSPDAELLALRPRLEAAVLEVGRSEMSDKLLVGASDEDIDAWVSRTGDELTDACWAIVDTAPAQTAEGRALKAAAAMHQLRMAYSHGGWPGDGEALAWDVLSELAGPAYVSPPMSERLREFSEPERRA